MWAKHYEMVRNITVTHSVSIEIERRQSVGLYDQRQERWKKN